MLKGWQFNILFFVGVGGVLLLLLGPELGLDVTSNPTALAALGSILAYILTQKKALTNGKKHKSDDDDDDDPTPNPPKLKGVDAISTLETDDAERSEDD
jgi:hypothetical protein